jgi:hypothetical protein
MPLFKVIITDFDYGDIAVERAILDTRRISTEKYRIAMPSSRNMPVSVHPPLRS